MTAVACDVFAVIGAFNKTGTAGFIVIGRDTARLIAAGWNTPDLA